MRVSAACELAHKMPAVTLDFAFGFHAWHSLRLTSTEISSDWSKVLVFKARLHL